MPSCHGRHRRNNRRSSARDWAALPRDVLFGVFLRLGPLGIILGADRVCTAWRRAAAEEPALWRRLDMAGSAVSRRSPPGRWRAAVERSAGQCEAFSGRGCEDDSLLYLVDRAPSLKSLRLIGSDLSHEVLDDAIKKLPLLEDLEISLSGGLCSTPYGKLFKSICEAGPGLKTLSLTLTMTEGELAHGFHHSYDYMWPHPGAKCAIPVMRELRCLVMINCDFTAQNLMPIIDKCPLLESLQIAGCIDPHVVRHLQEKCGARNVAVTSHWPLR